MLPDRGVGPGDTTWQRGRRARSSPAAGTSSATPTSEERVLLVAVDSPTQITVERGYEASTPGSWPAGTRMKKLSPITGFAVRRGVGRDHLEHRGHRRREPQGRRRRQRDRGVGRALQVHRLLGGLQVRRGGWPVAVVERWATRSAPRPPMRSDVRKVTLSLLATEQHDLYLGTFLNTDCGKISVSVDGVRQPTHDLYLNEYGGTDGEPQGARRRRGRKPHRRDHRSVRQERRQHRVLLLLRLPLAAGAAGRSGRAAGVLPTCRSPSTSTPTTATRSPRPGTSGNSRSSGSRATPTCTWASSGTTSGGASARPTRTPRSSSPATPVPGDVVSISIWRDHHQPRHRVRRDACSRSSPSCAPTINGMFAGVWADDNFGSSTTLRIQSKAPVLDVHRRSR